MRGLFTASTGLPAELYPRFSSAPQLIAVDLLSIVRPGSFVNNFFQNFSVFFEAGGGGKSCPFSHRRSSLPLAAVRPGAELLHRLLGAGGRQARHYADGGGGDGVPRREARHDIQSRHPQSAAQGGAHRGIHRSRRPRARMACPTA